jgi:hypothetical protein
MKLMHIVCWVALLLSITARCHAHHVLGRPAYSLNEDSNTPPSMQIETRIGNYFVSYMVYPAFPKPGEPGRINLYATRIDSAEVFDGEVTFKVRDDGWFSSNGELVGVQVIDDGVYRQGFIISEEGNYIITAEFFADDEPYTIDFPLRIGAPVSIGPLGLAIGVILLVLVGVNLVQRRRLTSARIRHAHEESRS